MKYIKIIIILVLTICASSCSDYIEPDEIAFVSGVGIDAGKNGDYDYTLQFARPIKITSEGSGEQGNESDTTGTITVSAQNIYEAVNVANHIVSKKFTLAHTKVIIISENVAKEGIGRILDSIARSSDLRPNVYICIARDTANNYLNKTEPVIEVNPVKYYRLLFENNYSSYIPVTESHEVFFNYKNNRKQNVLPLVSTEKGTLNTPDKNENSEKQGNLKKLDKKSDKIPENKNEFEYKTKEYIAGNLDTQKSNESEAIGGAVFSGEKMVGILNSADTELYNILNGTFRYGYTQIFEQKGEGNNTTTLETEQLRLPKITVNTQTDSPIINITVFLEGNLISTPKNAQTEDALDLFKKRCSKYIQTSLLEFLKKTQSEYNSDILGFGNFAKRNFLTEQKYNDYCFNDKYKNAKFNVTVLFNIRKSGLIIDR